MNEEILTHRDRLDLRAVLFREISYVGVSSAAGKRAKELLAKVDAMDARPKVKTRQTEVNEGNKDEDLFNATGSGACAVSISAIEEAAHSEQVGQPGAECPVLAAHV